MNVAPSLNTRRLERTFIWGTPDSVVKQLKEVLDNNRVGILALWGNDGNIDHKDSMTCIKLLGEEVVPAIRDYGKELGLKDPWEAEAPISLQFNTPGQLAGAAG